MKPAHTILQEGVDTLAARAKLRDAAGGERSMARTVAIFNAWTGGNMSEQDGWRFMIALKQAREVQGKFNLDDYVDMASYAALLGENQSIVRKPLEAPKVLTPADLGPIWAQTLERTKEEANKTPPPRQMYRNTEGFNHMEFAGEGYPAPNVPVTTLEQGGTNVQ